jgi:hypothetical protein
VVYENALVVARRTYPCPGGLLDFQNTWKSALLSNVHDKRIALCPDKVAVNTGSAKSVSPEEPICYTMLNI